MRHTLAAALPFLLCSGISAQPSTATVSNTPLAPNTSFATIPVAYFGGTTEARPAGNLDMLAKQRLVMVEKWEGRCWADCLANSTKTPPLPCHASCNVEADMVATLKAVKRLNPGVSTVFYWNTLLAFPFYTQVGTFASNNLLLMDANTKQPVQLRNDNGMPGIGVYDHGKPAARALWLELVTRLQSTGVVDGFFGDKWQVQATTNVSGNGSRICNHGCGGITDQQAAAFNAGLPFGLCPHLQLEGGSEPCIYHFGGSVRLIWHASGSMPQTALGDNGGTVGMHRPHNSHRL